MTSKTIIPILNKTALFIIISFSIILWSCGGSQEDEKLNKIPVKEIKHRINENSKLIETLEASGNISFDSPENSGTGWMVVRIKKPDSVYVIIEGPFGISIANALITRKNFIYYNAQENKAIMGPTTDLNIGVILKIKVSFDDLINSFTGGFHFNDESADSTDAESENSYYVLQVSNSQDKGKYYIEPAKFTIQKYNLIDANNTTKMEVNYSDYINESASGANVLFPNKIVIKNPVKSQTVYIEYSTRDINKTDLKFNIKIPKSAKVIKWE